MNPTEAELENFRQKWREEVSAKAKGKAPASRAASSAPQASSSKSQGPKSNAPAIPVHTRLRSVEEVDEVEPHVYHDLGEKQAGRRLGDTSTSHTTSKEPQSALEHYEKAVERESQGSLGDSLNHYRKAFKLDSNVHQTYKNKHFPASSFQPPKPKPSLQSPSPSTAPVTVPNTAHHSLQGLPPNLHSLIQHFSTLTIQGEPPPTDLSPAPPCPISTIPEELLVQILEDVAIDDIASFARLAQVCKRLAYLVTTEDRIWKRIALGSEFGFGAMHYTWACQIDGSPLDDNLDGYVLDPDENETIIPQPSTPVLSLTAHLIPTPYPTHLSLFRLRPRLRFNGVYISTCNYTRPGASSPTVLTWNSPIHIVTYYRYLRFFRNGTCIALLTTSEPADVIPYLYPEHLHRNHGALPSAPMKDALPGRWRLSGPEGVKEVGEEGEKEGTVYVETEGAAPKYLNKYALKMASAGRGARNNKLAWLGYWSYNKLTDDMAEYGLRNEKPFYFSRVKSYGMGL